MSRRITLCLLAPVALVCACRVGPQISEFPAARQPQGANLEIVVRGEENRLFRNEGELIDVRDAGLLIELEREDSRHLVLVAWSEIDRLDATELDGFFTRYADSANRRDDIKAEYRLISRFPQGLSDDLLARLLAAYRQEAPGNLADFRE